MIIAWMQQSKIHHGNCQTLLPLHLKKSHYLARPGHSQQLKSTLATGAGLSSCAASRFASHPYGLQSLSMHDGADGDYCYSRLRQMENRNIKAATLTRCTPLRTPKHPVSAQSDQPGRVQARLLLCVVSSQIKNPTIIIYPWCRLSASSLLGAIRIKLSR